MRQYNDKETALLDDLRALFAKHGAGMEISWGIYDEEDGLLGSLVTIKGHGIEIEVDWYFGQTLFPDLNK